MRAVLCMPDLRAINGHAFNLALGFREEMARRGIELTICADRALAPALAAEVDALPVFHDRAVLRFSNQKVDRRLRAFLRRARRFRQDLRGVPTGGAVVISPNAEPRDILGLALLVATSRRRPAKVAINVMNEWILDRTKERSLRRRYRFALHALRLAAGKRLALSSSSEILAAELRRLAGRPVSVLPMPKLYPYEVAGGVTVTPRPVVISVVGTPRQEKGWHLLPGIAARLQGAGYDCRLEVQATHEPPWAGAPTLDEVAAAPGIELTVAALSRSEYFERLARSHIVLLPYDPAAYAGRTSGIFAEAVALGLVIVAPGRTWCSKRLDEGRGAGVAFETYDEAAIARAVTDAIDRLPELSALATARAAAWRARENLPCFVSAILGADGGRSSVESVPAAAGLG